jgi:Cu/Ag efflux pump CusA
MAYAIMGGLLVATVLTLVLLPTLYVTVFDRSSSAADKADIRPRVVGALRS